MSNGANGASGGANDGAMEAARRPASLNLVPVAEEKLGTKDQTSNQAGH